MKKILKPFPMLSFAILPAGAFLICSWQTPNHNNYSDKGAININQKDTIPKYDYKVEIDMQAFNQAMKNLDKSMTNLDLHMKDLDLNFGKQLESLSTINFDEIQKQTEASVKSIDWDKMQKDVDVSLQNVQREIAKIDFSKMQNQMKELQEKFQSDEFKSQFNSEKLHRQIDDAMSKAKEGIEKAKEKLQQIKDFTGIVMRVISASTFFWHSGQSQLFFHSNYEKPHSSHIRRYQGRCRADQGPGPQDACPYLAHGERGIRR